MGAETGGGLKTMVLISLLLRKGSAALNSENFNHMKSTWLDCYSKAVMLSKPSMEKAYFTKLNKTLSYFDPKEVEDMLLSNCKKALLREPEVAAPAISHFFKQYANPTDSFAVSFLQIVSTTIVSTNDDVRKHIADAIGAVACHISDGTVLSKFIEQLFDLFKSNSTKLPQRTSVATAILYACKNVETVTNYEPVIAKFGAALPAEANDVVLRLIWIAFAEWIVKVAEMPSSSLPILKKGINSQGDTKSISLRVAAYVFDKFGNVAVDSEILKAANAVYQML
uniref:Stalled ribosome sensor GCN1-like N-terminal domain-containing protein n=1 Tax=Panagrolaimus superbus TaxID=310955 RepID=A0A914Y2B9_9BILA